MRIVIATTAALAAAAGTAAAQPLETETARVLPAGEIHAGAGAAVDLSTAADWTQVPFLLRAGLGRGVELGVDAASGTAGFGDLEATIAAVVAREGRIAPAIAIAGQVQAPTTAELRAGRARRDYTGTVIASKRIGPVDVHAAVGYEVVAGSVDVAVAARLTLGQRFELYAEAFGETESLTGAPDDEADAAGPEADPGEGAAAAGLAYRIAGSALVSLGVSVDDRAAVSVRPGVVVARRF